jgi:methylenetetrahydrofolate reductase (NADPH)
MNAPITAAGSSTASFLRLSSIEITPKQVEKLPILKEKMVPGCRVFVALIDAGDLGGQIEAVKQLKAAGFQPVPHVPARFVKDEADLRARIKALAEGRCCGPCGGRLRAAVAVGGKREHCFVGAGGPLHHVRGSVIQSAP